VLTTGLVSVTFRQLSPHHIVKLVMQAGLDSIEWGGDVHVPHGNMAVARTVEKMMQDTGLFVSAYGSYYRLAEADSPNIDAVLDTAEALGTPQVRVWAGRRGSDVADATYRQAVIEDALRIVDLADKRNLTISLEYHRNTLTDTADSALDLLSAVNHPRLRTLWQPPYPATADEKVASLQAVLPYVTNLHVFYEHFHNRHPLADGQTDWVRYIDTLKTSGQEHVLSLEFVQNDDIQVFLNDTETLRDWVTSAEPY